MKIYAKIEDEKIVYPVVKKNVFKYSNHIIYNPKDRHYIEAGYSVIEPEEREGYWWELVIVEDGIRVRYNEIVEEELPNEEVE